MLNSFGNLLQTLQVLEIVVPEFRSTNQMLAQLNHSRLSNNSIDLKELWKEVRLENQDALAQLFVSTYSGLFQYGYRIIQNEALVKDMIQELFLNLWNKRNEISEAISVKSYLCASLRRALLRKIKRQRNRSRREYDYISTYTEETLNAEELIYEAETECQKKQQLMEALLYLSDRQKEAVYLKFFDGLSNNEISEVMDVNKQSVYNHISKAIQKMQNHIVPVRG